jgi:hypothetical protein
MSISFHGVICCILAGIALGRRCVFLRRKDWKTELVLLYMGMDGMGYVLKYESTSGTGVYSFYG